MNQKMKLLSAFFACAVLAGCASNQSTDSSQAEAAAAQAAAERAAAERAAAEQQAAAEREAARKAAEQLAMLKTVFYFDFDQSTLTAEARAALDAQIAYLKANTRNIRLEGHADERGTREYNMALGERRANSVADYMVVNGIARYRIETVSFGEERPVAQGSNESSWAQNRRVELK